MMLGKYSLPALLLVALFASATQAEILLYQRTIDLNRSVNIFDTSSFDLDIVLGDNQFAPSNPLTLFDSLVISPNDVGTILEASIESNSDFASAAGRLTDAINEYINVSITEDQTNGLTEQRIWQENRFFQQSVPINPPDLSGQQLTMLRVSIDSFNLETLENEEATLANEEATSVPPVELVLTLSFFGAIPEPSTLCLIAVGLFSTLMSQRRYKL